RGTARGDPCSGVVFPFFFLGGFFGGGGGVPPRNAPRRVVAVGLTRASAGCLANGGARECRARPRVPPAGGRPCS
ncbi:MAG: hypothetical protein ACK4YP_14765, partial [Myxococcota bacterium]